MADINRVLNGLQPNSRYVARVRAMSKFGVYSDWSEAIDFTTPGDESTPNPPTNLEIEFETATLILSWDEPTQNTDGTAILDFKSYAVSISDGTTTKEYKTVIPSFTYPFEQNRRDFGTPKASLDVEIRAVDVTNRASDPLVGVAVNPAPLKPETMAGISTLQTITLTMQPASTDGDISKYLVERSADGVGGWVLIAEANGDTYVDKVDSASTTFYYRYKVRDVFGQESVYSDVYSITSDSALDFDSTPPQAVEDFTIVGNGLHPKTLDPYVDVEWTPNNVDDDLAHYELRAVRVSDGFIKSYILGPLSSSYRIGDLDEGTEYNLVMYALDIFNNRSSATPTLNLTTLVDDSPPETPTNPVANGGIKGITVSWDTVSSSQLSHYEVYASDTSGFDPDASSMAPVFSGLANRFVMEVGFSETRYFLLRAVNSNGIKSPFTDEFSGTSDPEFELDRDTTPPSSITGLSVVTNTYYHGSTEFGKAVVSWGEATDDSGIIDHYVIRLRENGGSWEEIIVGGSATSYTLSALSPGSVYDFQMKAVDPSGNRSSSWSSMVQRTISTNSADTPDQVTGLIADANSRGVTFEWDETQSSKHNDYEVHFDDNSGFTSPTVRFTRATTISRLGLTGQTIYCRVRARDIYGNVSPQWSSTESGTVGAIVEDDLEDGAITESKIDALLRERLESRTLRAVSNWLGYGSTNAGEVYLHGFDSDGEPADVDGYVNYNGERLDISKGTILGPDSGPAGRQGWILFDPVNADITIRSDISFNNALHTQMRSILVFLEDGDWMYYDDETVKSFTPLSTDLAIGYWRSAGSGIDAAYIFASPVNLSEVVTSVHQLLADSILASHITADTINTDHIDVIDLSADHIFANELASTRLVIGSGSQFEENYDPSEKETPDGAQAKADEAESAAKAYADLEVADAITAAQSYTDGATDGLITTYYQSKTIDGEPSGDVGDLWIDTDTDRLYRYDGTDWKEIRDEDIAVAISDAQTAKNTADKKIQTFYNTTEPANDATNDLGFGDLWIDIGNDNELHIWDGDSWESVRDGYIDTAATAAQNEAINAANNYTNGAVDGLVTTYYQEIAPTDIENGDLWFDTENKKLYFYNEPEDSWELIEDKGITDALDAAQTAKNIADKKIQSFYQTSEPDDNLDNDLDIGDLWFDTDDENKPYIWDGSDWASVTYIDSVATSAAASALSDANAYTDTTTAGLITTYYQSGDVDGEPVGSAGDLWIDTDTGRLYRYDGTNWQEVKDEDIATALTNAQNAQDTADGKIQAFYQTDEPADDSTNNLDTGDLWFDTDDENKPYVWNGNNWQGVTYIDAVASAAAAQAVTDANQYTDGAVDGLVTTYYEPTEPSSADNGDLWFDTENKKLHRYDASIPEWILIEDQGITDALDAAQSAQVTADGKIQAFYQDNEPTEGMDHGDLWFDTSPAGKNAPHRYDSSIPGWVSIRDEGIDDLASSISTINGQIDSINNELITTYFSDTAPPSPDNLDLWYETDTETLRRYNGSSWDVITDTTGIGAAYEAAKDAESLADGKVQAYYQASEPSGLDTSDIGDLWFDTDDNNKPYYWDGDSWEIMLGTEISALNNAIGVINTTLEDDLITTYFLLSTAPPTSPEKNDLWYKIDLETLHRYDGSTWNQISDNTGIGAAYEAAKNAESIADGKVQSYYQATGPTGLTASDVGDLWFDTDDDNKAYHWDGDSWELVQGAELSSLSGSITNINNTLTDQLITTYFSDTAPSSPEANDVWYETDTGNLYRYNGSSWDQISDDTGIGAAYEAAKGAEALADSKIQSFYQNGPNGPVDNATNNLGVGDLWFDTDDSNKAHRWNGVWEPIRWGSSALDVSIGGGNLISDSSFEDPTFSKWSISGGSLALVTDPSPVHGSHVLEITSSGTATITLQQADMPVVEGQPFTVSAWVRTPEVGRSLTIRTVFYDAAGVQLQNAATIIAIGNSWTRVARTGQVVPANAVSMRVRFQIQSPAPGAAGEVFYLDAVQAELGDVLTAYAPLAETPEGVQTRVDKAKEDISLALSGEYPVSDFTIIDGGHIQTGSVNADVLEAYTAIVNALYIQALLQVNQAGAIESENFNDVANLEEGYRLDADSFQLYGTAGGDVSIILGSDGLNLNTSTGWMWFGHQDYDNAAWRVDGDGNMRVGTTNNNFNVNADGSLRIGGNDLNAPVYISSTGHAVFRDVVITGTDMTGTELIIDTSNFDVQADGHVIARSLEATQGGTIGNVSITPTSLSGGTIEGSTFKIQNAGQVVFEGSGTITWDSAAQGGIELSDAGYIKTTNYDGANGENGVYLDEDGLIVNSGRILAKALQIVASPENLFKNSSFENGSVVADNWTGLGGSTFSVVNEESLYQARSQKIVSNGGTEYLYQTVSAPGGGIFSQEETIAVTFWVKQTVGTPKSADIVIRDADNVSTIVYDGNATTLSIDNWVRASAVFRPTGGNYSSLRVDLRVLGTSANDTFYIDGAQFQISDFITTYAPASGEIPDNYIQSAHIQALSADRLAAGTIGPSGENVDIILGPNGSIGNGSTWLIDQDGASFQDGAIEIVGAGSNLTFNTSGLKLVLSSNTVFNVDSSGVYIGGGDDTDADVYFDGNKTVFKSGDSGHTFTIDTNPPLTDHPVDMDGDESVQHQKILALQNATDDYSFILDSQGNVYISGSINSDARIVYGDIRGSKMTIGSALDEAPDNSILISNGGDLLVDGGGIVIGSDSPSDAIDDMINMVALGSSTANVRLGRNVLAEASGNIWNGFSIGGNLNNHNFWGTREDTGVIYFYVGDDTSNIRYNGSNLNINTPKLTVSGGNATFSGTLSGGTINIGPNNFVVTSTGRTWWGASTWASSVARIDSNGDARFAYDAPDNSYLSMVGTSGNTRINYAHDGTTKAYVGINKSVWGTAKAVLWGTGGAVVSCDTGSVRLSYGSSESSYVAVSGTVTVSAASFIAMDSETIFSDRLRAQHAGTYSIECRNSLAFGGSTSSKIVWNAGVNVYEATGVLGSQALVINEGNANMLFSQRDGNTTSNMVLSRRDSPGSSALKFINTPSGAGGIALQVRNGEDSGYHRIEALEFVLSSDPSYKANAKRFGGNGKALGRLRKMTAYQYDRTDTPDVGRPLGFMADEAPEEIVHGSEGDRGIGLYGLQTFTAVAVQELADEHDKLKDQVTRLLQRIEELESRP